MAVMQAKAQVYWLILSGVTRNATTTFNITTNEKEIPVWLFVFQPLFRSCLPQLSHHHLYTLSDLSIPLFLFSIRISQRTPRGDHRHPHHPWQELRSLNQDPGNPPTLAHPHGRPGRHARGDFSVLLPRSHSLACSPEALGFFSGAMRSVLCCCKWRGGWSLYLGIRFEGHGAV